MVVSHLTIEEHNKSCMATPTSPSVFNDLT